MSVFQAMLDFEAALARAQARMDVIPAAAAAAITKAALAEGFDTAEVARQALRAGTPAIAVVRRLTERVRGKDPDAAAFVHWGPSQDVSDTALVLLLRQSRPLLAEDHQRVISGLWRLSEAHAGYRDAGPWTAASMKPYSCSSAARAEPWQRCGIAPLPYAIVWRRSWG